MTAVLSRDLQRPACPTEWIKHDAAWRTAGQDAWFDERPRKGRGMAIFAPLHENRYDVRLSLLCGSWQIIVLRPTDFWLLHEMEEVLVREGQSVRLAGRDGVRLMPDQVVAEDPFAILHCDGEASRDQ